MRYERDEIHPVLWKATDALNTRWMMGQMTETDLAVLPTHQSTWFKQYGRDFALAIVLPLLVVAVGVFLKKALASPFGEPTIAVGFLAMVVQMVVLFTRNNRQVSSQELANLLPALKLTGIPQSYTEAVIAVGQANHLTRLEKAEIL